MNPRHNPTYISEFAEGIKERRRFLGLTQAEIAVAAGVTLNTYAEIERGVYRKYRMSTFEGIHRALGIPAPGPDPVRPFQEYTRWMNSLETGAGESLDKISAENEIPTLAGIARDNLRSGARDQRLAHLMTWSAYGHLRAELLVEMAVRYRAVAVRYGATGTDILADVIRPLMEKMTLTERARMLEALADPNIKLGRPSAYNGAPDMTDWPIPSMPEEPDL